MSGRYPETRWDRIVLHVRVIRRNVAGIRRSIAGIMRELTNR